MAGLFLQLVEVGGIEPPSEGAYGNSQPFAGIRKTPLNTGISVRIGSLVFAAVYPYHIRTDQPGGAGMARHDIDKATVRNKLAPRREPYWGAPVERGLYVGFRRLAQGGNWIARYHSEDRSHVYQTLGPVTRDNDYENATRDAKRWRRTVDAGVQTDRILTVADVCRDYTDALAKEGRPRAVTDSRKRFDRIVHDDPIGKLRADKLTQRHLEAWMGRMEAGTMTGRKHGLPSRATFNRNLTSLKAALNRAVSRREIPQERAIEWGAIKPHKGADCASGALLGQVATARAAGRDGAATCVIWPNASH